MTAYHCFRDLDNFSLNRFNTQNLTKPNQSNCFCSSILDSKSELIKLFLFFNSRFQIRVGDVDFSKNVGDEKRVQIREVVCGSIHPHRIQGSVAVSQNGDASTYSYRGVQIFNTNLIRHNLTKHFRTLLNLS